LTLKVSHGDLALLKRFGKNPQEFLNQFKSDRYVLSNAEKTRRLQNQIRSMRLSETPSGGLLISRTLRHLKDQVDHEVIRRKITDDGKALDILYQHKQQLIEEIKQRNAGNIYYRKSRKLKQTDSIIDGKFSKITECITTTRAKRYITSNGSNVFALLGLLAEKNMKILMKNHELVSYKKSQLENIQDNRSNAVRSAKFFHCKNVKENGKVCNRLVKKSRVSFKARRNCVCDECLKV
tara:strand:+ start:309 stop:1019 length:711 start_codon:yes stop_codon:yes gene_type:complete